MTRFTLIFTGCLLSMAFLATGCLKDSCNRTVTYIKPIPVYKTLEDIRVPLSVEPAQSFQNPGKIYTYGKYLLVNDYLKGIHVINNADPSNPVSESFISIPGNIDMAVKDNILYADNYIDLLAINLNDIAQPFLEKRIENAFPAEATNDQGELLVGYEGDQVTEAVDCNWNPDPSWRLISDSEDASFSGAAGSGGDSRNVNSGSTTGTAGSMAQFAIVNDFLYIIEDADMHLYSIVNPNDPVKTTDLNVGLGIETIFPHQDKLFIGANDGMYIFENSNPSNPHLISKFEHFTACDPVVVEGNFAYVTLRADNACGGGWRDEMQVVDISDLSNPFLALAENSVREPKGLAVKNQMVYLCDGFNGLQVFQHNYDVNQPWDSSQSMESIQQINSMDAYDAIIVPKSELLLIIGQDGLYQYDITNPSNLVELSRIGF